MYRTGWPVVWCVSFVGEGCRGRITCNMAGTWSVSCKQNVLFSMKCYPFFCKCVPSVAFESHIWTWESIIDLWFVEGSAKVVFSCVRGLEMQEVKNQNTLFLFSVSSTFPRIQKCTDINPILVLRGTKTAYTVVHFLHQRKFTMYRPATPNILHHLHYSCYELSFM